MKTMRLLKLFCLAVFVLAAGCKKEDDANNPNAVVPDPTGTISLSMRNSSNGGTVIDVENSGSDIFIAQDDNFTGGLFASLGAMKGLGNVTYIPETGWANKVAVNPGEGYVCASIGNTGVTYIRMYVVDYILSSISEGVIGANIKYQYPFNGDSKKITLTRESETSQLFSVMPLLSWQVSADAPWCHVNVTSKNSFVVSPEINNTLNARQAVITLTSQGLEPVTYTYVQPGLQPSLLLDSYSLQFDNASSSKNLVLTSNSSWTAQSDAAWCSVSPLNGGAGTTDLTISTSENTSEVDRTATITFNATNSNNETLQVKVTVTQTKPDFAGGTGTQVNPFQIKTPLQLDNLRKYSAQDASIGKFFKLMNDIDLSLFLQDAVDGWTPISDFWGTLDGGGFVIRNFWVNKVTQGNAALFDNFHGGGILNLGLIVSQGKSVTAANGDAGGFMANAFNNFNDYVSITNSYVIGNISGANRAGGLAGYAGYARMSECFTEGNISGKYSGGLVGYAHFNDITDCYSLANVYGKCFDVFYYNAGGLVGFAETDGGMNFENCFSAGSVQGDNISSNAFAGGFIGFLSAVNSTDISNCYFDKDNSGQASGFGYESSFFSNTINAESTARMKRQSTFNGWNFVTIWSINEGVSYPYFR